MSAAILAGMAITVFFTAMLSGMFGMAGGLILLWVLLFLMPIGTAIAVHGVIQMVSNGSRAWFSRHYIDHRILLILCIGLVISATVLLITNYKPDIIVISIVIGLMPLLVWLPVQRLHLDASRTSHALVCGLIAGALTVGVGVSGPTIDIFFIRTTMDRRKVIATKAAIQVISHATKVVFYWNAATQLPASNWIAILIAAPIAIFGTSAGHAVLQRMTDANFRAWTRWIVTGVGFIYLVQGVQQLT